MKYKRSARHLHSSQVVIIGEIAGGHGLCLLQLYSTTSTCPRLQHARIMQKLTHYFARGISTVKERSSAAAFVVVIGGGRNDVEFSLWRRDTVWKIWVEKLGTKYTNSDKVVHGNTLIQHFEFFGNQRRIPAASVVINQKSSDEKTICQKKCTEVK